MSQRTVKRHVVWGLLMASLMTGDIRAVRGQAEAPSAGEFPPVELLPVREGVPHSLVFLNGRKVSEPEEWYRLRRPELKRLFQHYMYGFAPPAPTNLRFVVEREDRQALNGTATLREVTLTFGPDKTPPIHALVVLPNRRTGPVPVFVGLNFAGNHALLADPAIRLPTAWVYDRYPGVVNNQATDAGRGSQVDVWALDQSIARGYAVVTAYAGDIDPDKPDFTDGVHPHFRKAGQTEPGPHDWGTIAAWAWGLSRMVDYIHRSPEFDPTRIAVVGHSRLGKTALLAGALDERIDLIIPSQAGCGGTAPSRGTVGESVKQINDRFPHWFNDTFPLFNEQVQRLPFDQHSLIALCAPRPVLLTNAEEDQWANPDGQFQMLHGAAVVYRFLGVGDLKANVRPPLNQLISGRLGYFIRPGKHAMTRDDWKIFLDYADQQLSPAQ